MIRPESLIEHEARALGPLRAGAEAGHLRHRPEPAPVAVRLGAARVRILAGEAHVAQVVETDGLEIRGRGEPLDGPVQRLRFEAGEALAFARERRIQRLPLPLLARCAKRRGGSLGSFRSAMASPRRFRSGQHEREALLRVERLVFTAQRGGLEQRCDLGG